jgi:outer membrane protein
MKKLFMMLMLFAPLATFAQQKFGHINAQEVMASMPEFIKVRGEIEATAKQYENDLKAMQDELQRKAQEYDKSKSTMNETKQKETEQTLMDLQQKIQQAYQDNSQALQKAQQEKMAPITQRLVNAIQAVGKAGGYVYIMDTQMGIPYVSETLSKDVTAEVKAELNKPSAAKKK